MILLNEDTKCLVQGITGKQGSFHTEQMLKYNTNIVAGLTPGKGGQKFLDKVPIFNSFEEATQYEQYTYKESPWCLTYMRNMFDTYTRDGMNQIYFCLRNGFENEEPIVGNNAPLDSYGLSMLSVIVNESGELAYCTTRWNHENGGSDSAMSAKEISQVVGVNFYEVFKPNNKWQSIVDDAIARLQNGETPYDVFDYITSFSNGFAEIQLQDKWNFMNENEEIISNQWFDTTYSFSEGFARVIIDGKYNFINEEGQKLCKEWFDNASDFEYNGYAYVKIKGKENYINQEGQKISSQGFDSMNHIEDNIFEIESNGVFNLFVVNNGISFPEMWFDKIEYIENGYFKVTLENRQNIVKDGLYLLSQNKWFDNILEFNDIFFLVESNQTYNLMNIDGDLLYPNIWFNKFEIYDGDYGSDNGDVMFKNKFNVINSEGKLISPKIWFDEPAYFRGNYEWLVKVNGKEYIIDEEGYIIEELNETTKKHNMNQIKLSESELYDLIKESINHILLENDDYIKYQKFGSPYDNTKKGNGQTQPLKDNIYLDRVRAMLSNVLIAFKHEKYEDAKKQELRIYKLVDAMINQS